MNSSSEQEGGVNNTLTAAVWPSPKAQEKNTEELSFPQGISMDSSCLLTIDRDRESPENLLSIAIHRGPISASEASPES